LVHFLSWFGRRMKASYSFAQAKSLVVDDLAWQKLRIVSNQAEPKRQKFRQSQRDGKALRITVVYSRVGVRRSASIRYRIFSLKCRDDGKPIDARQPNCHYVAYCPPRGLLLRRRGVFQAIFHAQMPRSSWSHGLWFMTRCRYSYQIGGSSS
jgi:hypothetical protein